MEKDSPNLSAAPPSPILPLLTPDELALGLKSTLDDIEQLRYRHGLPYISLVSGEVRYEPAAVNAWLKRRSKKGARA